jgi:hypothetical protein
VTYEPLVIKADIRCQHIINKGRPDRGPEYECGRRVRFQVPGWSDWVCSIHARAYTRAALRPVVIDNEAVELLSDLASRYPLSDETRRRIMAYIFSSR